MVEPNFGLDSSYPLVTDGSRLYFVEFAVCFAHSYASLHFGWRDIGNCYAFPGESNRRYFPGPVLTFNSGI